MTWRKGADRLHKALPLRQLAWDRNRAFVSSPPKSCCKTCGCSSLHSSWPLMPSDSSPDQGSATGCCFSACRRREHLAECRQPPRRPEEGEQRWPGGEGILVVKCEVICSANTGQRVSSDSGSTRKGPTPQQQAPDISRSPRVAQDSTSLFPIQISPKIEKSEMGADVATDKLGTTN